MRLRKRELSASSALILGALFASIPLCPPHVFAQTPLYQGKTITILQEHNSKISVEEDDQPLQAS